MSLPHRFFSIVLQTVSPSAREPRIRLPDPGERTLFERKVTGSAVQIVKDGTVARSRFLFSTLYSTWVQLGERSCAR
jgi:hypothetical protein